MGKFYTANEEFKKHLVKLGLTFHNREEPSISYYTFHKNGRQVKIDNKNNFISLLDNRGETVEESTSFTDNQISSFINQ